MSVDAWIESLILTERGEHALTWGLMSIAFILFPIRLYLRYSRYQTFLSDDYILFPAILLLIALGAIHTYQYPILFRAHHLFITKTPFPPYFLTHDIPTLLKTQFVKTFLVWTTQYFCKLSFLLFLRRLLRVWPAYMRWWWAVLVISTTAWLSVILINCFTCFPPKRKWEGNSCNNPHDIAANNNGLIAATILDITSDIFIIILPYRLLMCLKIQTRHKFILFGIFSMSIFLVFLAIFRIVLLYKARETHSIWLNGIVAAQFGQIFGNMAVIIAILPALRLFFTEEQRKGFTMDVEKMQKAKAAGAGASGDTTLFSTTWSPEDGEQLPTPGIEKNTRDVQIAAGVANPPSSTTGGSNVIRKLGSLGGLRNLIRRDSGLQTATPSSHPDAPEALSRAQSMQIASTPRPQTEVPPLQVKLHQVIPDIGGETSPVIRTK